MHNRVTRPLSVAMLAMVLGSLFVWSVSTGSHPVAARPVAATARRSPTPTARRRATTRPTARPTTRPTQRPATATAVPPTRVPPTATRPAATATTIPATAVPSNTYNGPRQLTAVLRGSGATFPNPLYQAWIQVYKQSVVPGVSISYNAVGSGQGISDFIKYLTDFGGTDAAINAQRVENEAPDALHVPMVIGGVVPTYNLPGNPQLRFSGSTLAGIYLGTIRRWNDPALAAENPGVTLPALDITPVYRSDGSGTTSIFTDYLSKVSAQWASQVGSGTSVRFPKGIGAPQSNGVASTVRQVSGAIGYVELVYALANNLPAPAIRNASGNYVTPTLGSVSAAAQGINYPAIIAVSITNSPNAQAYPIAGFTYLLIREATYTDPTKAQALTDFIYWCLTEGQGAANRLGYAPLPTQARQLSIGQLRKITVNGQRVFNGPVQ